MGTDSPERANRIVPESEGHFRSPFRRDRDRILYTREFRRLKDVTQVARVGESYLYHDRLTHSEKVAQVGGSLSRIVIRREEENDRLGIDISEHVDPYAVEAACLAHDIGHPPFGHVVEDLLDGLIKEYTRDEYGYEIHGFEGNAQSFRIVANLAKNRQYGSEVGLNLTRATLNAVQKYPWMRGEDDDKWGFYKSEEDQFEFARERMPEGSKKQSTEAQIMDYADDLTYAVHDVDDFYRSGLIPLGELFKEATSDQDFNIKSSQELDGFRDHLRSVDDEKIDLGDFDVTEFFDNLTELAHFSVTLYSPFRGTDEERAASNAFISGLIGRYLESNSKEDPQYVHLEENDRRIDLVKDEFETQIEVLKQLTVHYVINNPTLMAQQRGQRQVIRDLFDVLYQEADRSNLPRSAIPSPYRERLRQVDERSPDRARIIADMISAMTEPQAISLHKRLTGDTPGSLQNEILR